MCLTASHPLSSAVDAAIAARVALMNDKSDIKRMFTATDIKLDVRASVGRQVPVVQADIRNLVHAKQFDLYNAGYTRVAVQSPTGETLLYLPAGDDENEYVNAFFGGGNTAPNSLPSPNTTPAATGPSISVSSPTLGGAIAAAVSAAAAATASKVQMVDADYRLPVYGDMLKEIGAEPNGTVIIYVEPQKRIVVAVPDNQGAQPYAKYTVNADGRIRISGKVLDVNLPSIGRKYRQTVNAAEQTIVIEPA